MAEKKPLLRATNLQKSFDSPIKVTILHDINFTAYPGEAIAITGRSGEGKSTLMHLLGTLEEPSGGTLEIAGVPVQRYNQSYLRNRYLAFIFQSFHLLTDYTTLDNVLMPAKIGRQSTLKGSKAYNRACELLERVGLKDRMHFDTKLLSGGERQRVAIARALCNNPDLILADEPSGNLDQHTAAQIHHLLLELAKQEGKGVIIVTHDSDLANLCDKQYLLRQGQLQRTKLFSGEITN